MKEKLSQKRREKVGHPTAPLKRHQVYVRVCVDMYVPQVGTCTHRPKESLKAYAVLLREEAHIQCHGRLPPPSNSSIIITPYTQSSLLCVIITYIQQMNTVVTGNYDMVRDPPPFFSLMPDFEAI